MNRRKDVKTALLHTRQAELKTLVEGGRMDEAMESAQKWGMDVDAVLDAVGSGESDPPLAPLPVSNPEPVAVTEVKPDSEPISTPPTHLPPISPAPIWPEVADVVVASHPLNKRLYVIKLDDERRASLWRMGASFPVGAGIRVKLVEQVGDQAYYEPIHS